MNQLNQLRKCGDCRYLHFATRLHTCKEPPEPQEEELANIEWLYQNFLCRKCTAPCKTFIGYVPKFSNYVTKGNQFYIPFCVECREKIHATRGGLQA